MELSAGEDGICESPCVNQSAINFISGHGISEIISPDPNKVLVYCDDINTVTAKKKSRYATQTAAKKKEYAENIKRVQAEENRTYNETVPKLNEKVRRLENEKREWENKETELKRAIVLLIQPAPRHSSKREHEEI